MEQLHDFSSDKTWARSRRREEIAAILRLLPDCWHVEPVPDRPESLRLSWELAGVDYFAQRIDGKVLTVDAKSRRAGCARFWQDGVPELALEVWDNVETRKPGWTWADGKLTDALLFTWEGLESAYLWNARRLAEVFRRNQFAWQDRYRVEDQDNGEWTARCVFVPVPTVLAAMEEA